MHPGVCIAPRLASQGLMVDALLFLETPKRDMKHEFPRYLPEMCESNLNPVWQPDSMRPYLSKQGLAGHS
jgi:hypothetical protein